MNEAELIQLITRQVMAAMNAGPASAPAPVRTTPAAPVAPAISTSSPAPIHPPIGVCTGDYSKFEELRGKLNIAPAVASPAAPAAVIAKVSAAPAPAHNPAPKPAIPPVAASRAASGSVSSAAGAGPVLGGMVTEKMLKAAGSQVIQLAARAKLTPLALDYVKSNQLKLMTASDPLRPASGGASAAAAPWLAWIEGSCPASARVAGQFTGKLAMLQEAADLVEAIHELDERVKAGSISGGILFVKSAAKALCYANRCTSLRAALGHCLGAVRLAVDSLAANVLVLEYPFQPYYPMLGMARLFLAAPRPSTQAIEQELARLSHCACHKEGGA